MECSDPGQWIELGRQDCSSFCGLAAGRALTEDLTAATSASAAIPLLTTAVVSAEGSSAIKSKEAIGRGHQLGACALVRLYRSYQYLGSIVSLLVAINEFAATNMSKRFIGNIIIIGW